MSLITETVARLVPASGEQLDAYRAETTFAAHEAALEHWPLFNAVEISSGLTTAPALPLPLTVAAWNVERCLFPAATAARIASSGARLVLLSEMDCGMARTGQRDTTRDVAARLGMDHAYAVEFLELGLGSAIEREFCRDAFNELGFHGNAVMAEGPLDSVFAVRLWGRRIWIDHDPEQRRIGERIAVGAVVDTTAGPLLAVSVHLESAADAAYRTAQLTSLLDTIDVLHPGMPVVIGGDLNTGNHIGGDHRDETLFALAATRGYDAHGGPRDAPTTRPSLLTRFPDRAMKLDWFLTRGVSVSRSVIEPSLDDGGQPLSDHDLVLIVVDGLG